MKTTIRTARTMKNSNLRFPARNAMPGFMRIPSVVRFADRTSRSLIGCGRTNRAGCGEQRTCCWPSPWPVLSPLNCATGWAWSLYSLADQRAHFGWKNRERPHPAPAQFDRSQECWHQKCHLPSLNRPSLRTTRTSIPNRRVPIRWFLRQAASRWATPPENSGNRPAR